jgi:ATP-dependent HslUV protease ATP-binding subunit HslU
VSDFERILTEPKASLTEQYTALLATEGLSLSFSSDAVRRLAEIAWHVNETTENIGARRLHTVMERLLDEISFEAPDRDGQKLDVDANYVDAHLDGVAKNEDLSRYIL